MTRPPPPPPEEIETSNEVEKEEPSRELDVPEDDATEPPLPEDVEWLKASEHFRSLITPVPSAWYEQPPDPRRWLLRDRRTGSGLLPMGEVASLIAAGGVGKTMLILQLAISVSTGEPFLETFTPDPQQMGNVLLLLGEENATEAHRRLFAASRHARQPAHGAIEVMALKGLPASFMAEDGDGNPCASQFHAMLCQYVKRRRFALIIADPLSRYAGKDVEKDTHVGTYFVTLLEALTVAAQSAMLTAHHTPKASRGKGATSDPTARGTTALFDGVRSELVLQVDTSHSSKIDDPDVRERLGKIVTLTNSKSNYGREFEPLLLRRGEDGPLVPLAADDADYVRSLVEKPKSATRRAEAEERQIARQRIEDDRRERLAALKSAAVADQANRGQAALRSVLGAQPGASREECHAGIRALIGACSTPVADAIIARGILEGTVIYRLSTRSRRRSHYLTADAPPEQTELK